MRDLTGLDVAGKHTHKLNRDNETQQKQLGFYCRGLQMMRGQWGLELDVVCAYTFHQKILNHFNQKNTKQWASFSNIF